jgi:hypothetical protein
MSRVRGQSSSLLPNLFLRRALPRALLLFPLVLDDLLAPTVLVSQIHYTSTLLSGVLSAREEAALLGHLVAILPVCADHPGHADDAAEDEAHDGGVGPPVGRLGVPTARG